MRMRDGDGGVTRRARAGRARRHVHAADPAVRSLVLVLALVGVALPVDAQDRPTVEAVRMTGEDRIRLDGHLDEDVWRTALSATGFRQQNPAEGAEPTEPTEIRILYDAESLYIGALLYDSRPDGVIGHQRRRDAGLATDDRFMWVLDTFLDGRTGYFFEINPAGLMGDGLLGAHVNKSWDGIWEARVQRHERGWSAEIRIPFSTLNFDPTLDRWGINFQRTIRRKNEEILWSGWRRNQGLFRTVHAGRLTGLRDLSQGLGLEVKPYTVGNWTRPPGTDVNTFANGDAGFDVSYNITPSLRAALTVNTDFAEVEVDQRRVNLTRFPLRFEERRDFFLEGSGVYAFATSSGPSPYFSRRIGLVGGEPVPIIAGARLGGQAGRYELGFLQIRTGDGPGLGPEDFTVARAKRSLMEQSSVGLIYTRRATHARTGDTAFVAAPDRHTIGWDLDLFTSRFLGSLNAQFEAFAVLVTDPIGDGSTSVGDRSARGIRMNFPNDRIRFHTSLREFGEAYDPTVGFIPRVGFRRLQPSFAWAPRPDFDWLRQLTFEVFFEYLTDLDGRLLTRNERLTLLDADFESGDNVDVEVSRGFERIDQPFRIRQDVTIPRGAYTNREWKVSAQTAGRRRLSGSASLAHGGFWTGDRTVLEGGFTARPVPGWAFGASFERNDVDLPEGSFTTNLARVTGAWDVSPRASLTSNIQYDNVSRVLGLFARVRWILRPGNDLFLVYTHNWLENPIAIPGRPDERRFETLSRGAAAKLTYAIRF